MTNLTRAQQLLQTQLPQYKFQFNFSLADKAFFKIGGLAEAYLELDELEQVCQLVKLCTVEHITLTVLGGGSNVLVADQGVKGVVLQLNNDQLELVDKNKSLLMVGAGGKTSLLVKKSVDLGLTGLEPFLGVPGRVGGAIYNNAHYLSSLIGQFVSRVQVVDRQGQAQWLTQAECQFGYDTSRFQRTHEVIFAVEFSLSPGDQKTSERILRQTTVHRAQTQPLGEPSSGCIFQNAPNTPQLKKLFPQFANQSHVSAGFLIDQAGLKGETAGDIQVSHKHAAFFVNQGRGKSRDVIRLVKLVKDRVKERFGVELKEEIFYLGQDES